MDNKIRTLCVVILVGIFIFSIGLFVAYGDDTPRIKFGWKKAVFIDGYKVTVKKCYNDICVIEEPIDVGDVDHYIYIISAGSGVTEYCFTVRFYGVAPVTNQYIESADSREVCIGK
jgi:hypothetical protein